ncbi:class I histocompatibility antigen, F10 alpha chain-like [Podargus strigoides]
MATSVFDCTHLVTDRVRRTVKFLCAVARGVPIITPKWLHKSARSGRVLVPGPFLVRDSQQERHFGFSLAQALRRARCHPLLQGPLATVRLVVSLVSPGPRSLSPELLSSRSAAARAHAWLSPARDSPLAPAGSRLVPPQCAEQERTRGAAAERPKPPEARAGHGDCAPVAARRVTALGTAPGRGLPRGGPGGPCPPPRCLPRFRFRLRLPLATCGAAICPATGLHSLRYFDVAVSKPSPGVPEFVTVGYVDGNPFVHYDSERGKMEPQADWMVGTVDEQYWDTETQITKQNQHISRVNLDTARSRYNTSGRGLTRQRMYGCDLLEDGSTRGFYQSAYDGKDFVAFDMATMTFTAADEAALTTKQKWEKDGTVAEQRKYYLQNTCVEWLKKYVSYGRSVLERKERPAVRVSGKEAHGILTLSCRAYGFYPRPISISWLKDGEVRDQETEWGSTVPNSNGTFYAWASIGARPEERDRFRCRVEHASLPEPGLFAWEPEPTLLPIVLGVAVVLLAVIAVIGGVIFWKCRQGKTGYATAPSTDKGSDSSAAGIPA